MQKKLPIYSLLLSFLLIYCTSVKKFISDSSLNSNILNSIGKQPEAISTSFADAIKEYSLDENFGNNLKPKRLSSLKRTPEGAYQLVPGFYEITCRSYCLRAGTHGPSSGDGYLSAPLKGTRKNIIQSLLKNSEKNLSIQQSDVQLLIWAILARADFSQLSGNLKLIATKLLSAKELFELNGGVLGIIPANTLADLKQKLPPVAQSVLEAENKMRELFSRGASKYEEFRSIAVLPGAASIDKPEFKRGRWCKHPDGYYIRFFPEGYQKTKVQVYLPASSSNNGKQAANGFHYAVNSSNSWPIIDLTIIVAVPGNTFAQRLGLGGGGEFGGGGSSGSVDDDGEVDDDYVKKKLPDCFKNALIKFGKTEDEIVEYFKNYHNTRCNKQFFDYVDDILSTNPDLTDCDVYSMWGYTTNFFYRDLNKWLREGSNKSKTREITQQINNGLDKLPDYSGKNVYRGLEIPAADLKAFLNDYKAGNTVVWESFISAGGTMSGSFAGRPRVNVIFEIEHLNGKDISSFADGIRCATPPMPPPEILIKPNSSFKSAADPVYDNKLGKWIIRVVQIK